MFKWPRWTGSRGRDIVIAVIVEVGGPGCWLKGCEGGGGSRKTEMTLWLAGHGWGSWWHHPLIPQTIIKEPTSDLGAVLGTSMCKTDKTLSSQSFHSTVRKQIINKQGLWRLVLSIMEKSKARWGGQRVPRWGGGPLGKDSLLETVEEKCLNPKYQMRSEVKVTQLCPTLWPNGLYSPWNSPGQNTRVGSLFLLQGIFPTQELNQGLLHCRWILHQLSYQGKHQWEGPRVSRGKMIRGFQAWVTWWMVFFFQRWKTWEKGQVLKGRWCVSYAYTDLRTSRTSWRTGNGLAGSQVSRHELRREVWARDRGN